MHAADKELLFAIEPGDHNRALLHSLSSYPGSTWLDTLPVAPCLRLDDQAFQDDAGMRLGVRDFTSVSQAWHCGCG
jgi:hypothetical protein